MHIQTKNERRLFSSVVITGIVLVAIFLTSCGVSKDDYSALEEKYSTANRQNEILADENNKLKVEIDDLKFGAERMLAVGKNQFLKNQYSGSKETLDTLIKKHPTSSEAKEAENLLKKVNAAIDNYIKEKATAEKKQKFEDEKRLANATSKMKKSFDKVQQIFFYNDKNAQILGSFIQYYIGIRKSGTPWIVFEIQYEADSWLFITDYIIVVDGIKFTITPNYSDIIRNNGSGSIWESYSNTNGLKYLKMMKAIANSKETIIRHVGQSSTSDRTVRRGEKQAILNVIDAYEALGGSLN